MNFRKNQNIRIIQKALNAKNIPNLPTTQTIPNIQYSERSDYSDNSAEPAPKPYDLISLQPYNLITL